MLSQWILISYFATFYDWRDFEWPLIYTDIFFQNWLFRTVWYCFSEIDIHSIKPEKYDSYFRWGRFYWKLHVTTFWLKPVQESVILWQTPGAGITVKWQHLVCVCQHQITLLILLLRISNKLSNVTMVVTHNKLFCRLCIH